MTEAKNSAYAFISTQFFEALVILPKEKDYKAQWGKKTEESNKMTQ